MEYRRTPDVEISVQVFNIWYTLRGFNAIRELKEFLDEHASDFGFNPRPLPLPVDPEPTAPEQAQSGNGAAEGG